MSNRKILVCNGPSYSSAVKEIANVVCDDIAIFRNPKEFDLILFTGGADITPELYGHTSPKGVCMNSVKRDKYEFSVYKLAIQNGIKMAGICRGFQFLNCLAGGKMIHHLDNHETTIHEMVTSTGELLKVNSLHHQAVLPNSSAVIVGITKGKLSPDYIGDEDELFDYHGSEIEAAIFPETGSFGVQYHPEMMRENSRGYTFFLEMVDAAMELPWEEFVDTYRGDINEAPHNSINTPN